jgi:ribonuclease D
MTIRIITTTEDLTNYIAAIPLGSYITIDTEFIREKSYYPHLCLVQVASETEAVIIDPLAPGINLEPLFNLVNNQEILKVFHAARQDIEIFYLLSGQMPQAIYDTQIAAMVCGYGESVGYDTLVKNVTGRSIDKSSRFSNWAHRPLTQKQLEYALSDVTHLRDVFEALAEQLEEKDRTRWIHEELAVLTDPQTYQVDPIRQLVKLRLRSSKKQDLARGLVLINWREERARLANKPRNTIIHDELIVELATNPPQSVQDMKKIRGIRDRFLDETLAEELISILRTASTKDLGGYPQPESSSNGSQVDPLALEFLRLLLKFISHKENVAERLIASTKDLTSLIRHGSKATVPCLQGWRLDIFGKVALDVLEEKVGISLRDGHMVIDSL